MKLGDIEVPDSCGSINPILSKIGNKWTVLVVLLLSQEAKRYNSLKREIDTISQKMLTQTLRSLEEDGLINRRVFTQTNPPSVEYSLTDLGRTLVPVLYDLCHWATTNSVTIQNNQEVYNKNNGK